MSSKGSATYQIRNVAADAQAIADALVNAAKDSSKVFTSPIVGPVSYSPGADETAMGGRVVPSCLTITIKEG